MVCTCPGVSERPADLLVTALYLASSHHTCSCNTPVRRALCSQSYYMVFRLFTVSYLSVLQASYIPPCPHIDAYIWNIYCITLWTDARSRSDIVISFHPVHQLGHVDIRHCTLFCHLNSTWPLIRLICVYEIWPPQSRAPASPLPASGGIPPNLA